MGDFFCVPESWSEPEREAAMWQLARASLPWARALSDLPRGGDEHWRAGWCLARAQRAGYVPDPLACEWYQSPDVTAAHGGDCDDLCILLVCLACACGLDARLRRLRQPPPDEDHLLCELFVGGAWRLADPSIAGARVGEHPRDAVARLGRSENRRDGF